MKFNVRNSFLALAVALGIGALAQLPSVQGVVAQGFELVARDGTAAGPSIRGQSAIPGLYFNSKGVGVTRHFMSGFASTANLPVLSTCGTSPAIVGNDFVGRITVGTTAGNACTLTFGTAYTTAPSCIVQNLTTGAAANVYAVTTTTIIWSSALADSSVLHYHCIGLADG